MRIEEAGVSTEKFHKQNCRSWSFELFGATEQTEYVLVGEKEGPLYYYLCVEDN